MRIKVLLGVAVLVLAGCSTTNKITTAGEKVRFVNAQPGSECQHLGLVTGTQSNWLSGVNNESVHCVVQQMIYVIKRLRWEEMLFMALTAQRKRYSQVLFLLIVK